MVLEQRIALASTVGGIGIALLMWALAGLQWVPPDFAYLIAAIGGGLALLFAGILWCHIGWLWLNSKGLRLGPAILIGLSIVGLIGGLAWGVRTWKANSTGTTKSQLDQTVQLECEWIQIPDTIPPDGWNEIQIFGGTMGIGLIGSSQPPGAKNTASIKEYPNEIYRCRFTNFGSSPVVNVQATLAISLREIVWTKAYSSSSGPVVKSLETTTPRTNLNSGGTFDFYIRNLSEQYAEVRLPTTTRVQAVGSNDWQNASLIAPKMQGFYLSPFLRNRTTTLLNLFMADVASSDSSPAVEVADVQGGGRIFHAYSRNADNKTALLFFFIPKRTDRTVLRQLFKSYAQYMPGGTERGFAGHIIIYNEGDLDPVGAANFNALKLPGVQIDFRGDEYVAGLAPALASAARQVPPLYKIENDMPVKVP